MGKGRSLARNTCHVHNFKFQYPDFLNLMYLHHKFKTDCIGRSLFNASRNEGF